MKARAIAQMASTWPSRDGNRYFILPQGLTYFDAKGIEALIAVAENRTMDSWTEAGLGRKLANGAGAGFISPISLL
ncbi:unnamed protein product [Effrenium voratum]|uniref:Uncharacterized protein n=1 Tax=Effrenium voratum TaxID=2562239 RepID=A0AA36IKL3_9DINO|nr:unnamed protein product [Effrenium voratum]